MAAHTAVTAIIVDDEPLARRRLRDLIGGVPWLRCVGEAADGHAAVDVIDECQPDLVFLDIQLPGSSGLDVLSRVKVTPSVIFTTAFDEYAVSAFELAALDYLLKPFGRDRFRRALDRARAFLERRTDADAVARARETLGPAFLSRVFARDDERIVPIRVTAIEWLEACDDFVHVYTGAGRFRLNITLTDVERRLDARVFVRVHRSYLVNLEHVVSWIPYDGARFQIRLRSGKTLLTSRQRSRLLRELGI